MWRNRLCDKCGSDPPCDSRRQRSAKRDQVPRSPFPMKPAKFQKSPPERQKTFREKFPRQTVVSATTVEAGAEVPVNQKPNR